RAVHPSLRSRVSSSAAPGTVVIGDTVTSETAVAHRSKTKMAPDEGRSTATRAVPVQSQSPTAARPPGSPAAKRREPTTMTLSSSMRTGSPQPSPSRSSATGDVSGQVVAVGEVARNDVGAVGGEVDVGD